MAVFTTFSEEALERYLVMFDIGELDAWEPIDTGIENSNYFVTLAHGDERYEFVLTITENLTFEDVPFFNDLFVQLVREGLPVPDPQRTLDGMTSTIFCGKPAWLFPRLPGEHPGTVTATQCETIGAALARIHRGGENARYQRANPYDPDWVSGTLELVGDKLDPAGRKLCESARRAHQELADSNDLVEGIVHGDLFRDNALFQGEKLTGIIDFYHACTEYLVQDVAITMNDWCTNPDGELDRARADALLRGYESVRALTTGERNALPEFRQAGALRFVLTRLLSGGKNGHLKDPEEFLRILRAASA